MADNFVSKNQAHWNGVKNAARKMLERGKRLLAIRACVIEMHLAKHFALHIRRE